MFDNHYRLELSEVTLFMLNVVLANFIVCFVSYCFLGRNLWPFFISSHTVCNGSIGS